MASGGHEGRKSFRGKGGGRVITGQEREAGVEIGDLGRRGARAQRRGFPRSGPQMRGPDGGRPSRDPGKTSNRPRLGRGTPDRAKKPAETKVLPARRLNLVLPEARVHSRQGSPVPPGRVNRTSRGAAAAPPIGCVRCVRRSRPKEGAGLVMRPPRCSALRR